MAIVAIPLAAVILALAAVLLVYAWYKIVYYIALALTPNLPGIFHYLSDAANWLAGKALDAFNYAYNQMLGWAESTVEPFVAVINDYVEYSEHLWAATRDFAFTVKTKFDYVTSVTIPAVANQVLSTVTQVVTPAIESAANSARDQAIGWAQDEANTVWTNTVGLVNGITGQLQTVIGGIEATVNAIPEAIDGAEHRAEGWAQGAIEQLQGWTQGAIEGVRGELQGGIGAVAGELHGFEGEARGAISGVAGRVTTLEGLTVIVEGAAVIAAVTTFDDWWRGCGEGSCDILGPLGSALGDIAELFSLGLLFGFLAYAAANPEDAARDTVDVIGPIVDSTMSFIESVV